MLAYIKGELASKNIGYIVIDVGGLGYKVFMSDIDMNNIGEIGEVVKVHTYYRVLEDDISIFGFSTQEELRLFELLISVSGVGAKTALTMLSKIEPSTFALAVITNDLDTLKSIPGVGAKSAQRIVLELKDKLKKEQTISELSKVSEKQGRKENKVEIVDSKTEEAMAALQVLGYTKQDIEKVLSKIEDKDSLTLEQIIKQALSNF